MRSYGQFCPLAQAVEVLGERWTLLIMRELLAGSTRFVEIAQGLPRISKSVLTARLHELHEAKIVDRVEDGQGGKVRWELTDAGRALRPIVEGIGVWSQQHLQRPVVEAELDVGLLMWDVRRSVRVELLGPSPVVVKFHFLDGPEAQRTYWLVWRDGEVELCLSNPMTEVDATVLSDLRSFTDVWIGRRGLTDALASGAVRVEGGAVARGFPAWIGLSPFAPYGDAADTPA